MPRINIWIRDSDLKKWKSIENKSEWVHERLNASVSSTKTRKHPQGNSYDLRHEVMAAFKIPASVMGIPRVSPEYYDGIVTGVLEESEAMKTIEHCVHSQPRGRCLNKGANRMGCNR